MEWFTEWWDALAFIEQVFYCIAIPATLLLIIQTIMLILGFGHGGEGVNFSDTSGIEGLDGAGMDGGFDGNLADGMDALDSSADNGMVNDGSNPGDFGTLQLFTLQGIVAFLCIFGWSGLIFVGMGLNIILSVVIAAILGFAAMIGVAKIIQLTGKLQQNGSLVLKNLLGELGTVYLAIPAEGSGKGKVTVYCGERFLEFDAVTDEEQAIPNNTPIRVVDIRGGNVLVVEKAI